MWLLCWWSGLVGNPRSGGGRGDLMLLLLLRGFLHDCVCRAVCLTNNPGQYFIFRSSRVPIYLGRCIDSSTVSTQLHTAITSLSRFPSLHSGCSRVLPGTGALLIVGSFYRKVDCPVVKYLCYIWGKTCKEQGKHWWHTRQPRSRSASVARAGDVVVNYLREVSQRWKNRTKLSAFCDRLKPEPEVQRCNNSATQVVRWWTRISFCHLH